MELPDDPSKLGMGTYSTMGIDITKDSINYNKAVSSLPWQLQTDDRNNASFYEESDNVFTLGGSCW